MERRQACGCPHADAALRRHVVVDVDGCLLVPQLRVDARGRLCRPALEGLGVVAEQARDRRQIPVRLDEEGVEERGLERERRCLPDPVGKVVEVAEEPDEVDVPVVLVVCRALRGVRQLGVDPLVLGDLVRRRADPRQRLVPEGGVVHARLPGMPDLHESVAPTRPLAVQVRMPGGELRRELFEERPRLRTVTRPLVDAPCRSGVNRRLDDAGRLEPRRSIRRPARLPEVRAREIAPVAFREDDVRQQPVAPLAGEQRAKLRLGPILVPARISHGDARGVPAPLVGVQVAGTAWSRARASSRRAPPTRCGRAERPALGAASLRLYGRRACPSGPPTRFVIAL